MIRLRFLVPTLILPTLFLASLLAGCRPSPIPPVLVEPIPRTVRFLEDVKPVLDRRCVVCHSCYNAPCQLKLDAFEGVERGGSKRAVYDPARLAAVRPTRLFVDAHSVAAWRKRDFHSVLESRAESPANDALLLHLLDAKRRLPKPTGDYHAEAADLACPADRREMATFLEAHPERGMPFGLPALSGDEYAVLATWIAQGAPGPDPEAQRALVTPDATAAREIAKWEAFLNAPDAKHAMTARYLYEHFFLAHVRFTARGAEGFYELVRSKTPPGEPVDIVSTVRPYDDPRAPHVYYRFRKIHSTIVHKTHMVVDFGDDTLARYRELFIEPEWLEPPHAMPWDAGLGANPFVIYAQIPPRSRYAFLLDHAEYILRTFIRGPVCKGQVALNVIHDHFWVLFMDPYADLAVVNPGFLVEQANNLRLPNEQGSEGKLTKTFSDDYRERYVEFYRAKQALYDRVVPDGQGLEAIWRGRRASDAPLLTVYRHFDSASVHKGALGKLPRTLWVIDYAQLERIYYALVAGFDVFGNLAHQVGVRRYMDYLRMEGELNFIHFLPSKVRDDTFRAWYRGPGAHEDTHAEELLSKRGTRVAYTTKRSKRELVERVVAERLLPAAGIGFDPINYRRTGETFRMPASFESHEDVYAGLRAMTRPGVALVEFLHGYEVNVVWVRVRGFGGTDRHLTIVANRWHDNVSSLFFEKSTLDPSKDRVEFIPGLIGSYPSYFVDVEAKDIPDFFDLMTGFDGSPEYVAKLAKYGINRADERFWPMYDWFQARAFEDDPNTAGIFDLNRYHPTALD
ncbi:MAG: fatty acid cis/trans isomerase [Myxococcota bacterium]